MVLELQALLTQKDEEIARLKLEAQAHAQEARTANATIAEIYQVVSGATGEPGNWHGAEPVRTRLNQLQADLDRVMGEAVWAMHMFQFYAKFHTEEISQDEYNRSSKFLEDPLVQSWRARQGKAPKP